MKTRSLIVTPILALFLILAMAGCASITTVSIPGPTSAETVTSFITTTITPVIATLSNPVTTIALTTIQPLTTTASGGGFFKAALALEATVHPAAYATLCIMCHGPGVGAQQYPMAGTWNGTSKTPGTFTIAAGSDADHTGRTNASDCVKSGCHAKSW